jgi:hypothetical protein
MMVRPADGLDITAGFKAAGGQAAPSEVAGWWVAAADDLDSDEVVAALSGRLDGPALAGWIYDSSYAYLHGSDPQNRAFSVVLGEPYQDFENDELVAELTAMREPRTAAAQAALLTIWADTHGRAVLPSRIMEIMDRREALVEDALGDLYELLGLPDFDAVLRQVESRPSGLSS